MQKERIVQPTQEIQTNYEALGEYTEFIPEYLRRASESQKLGATSNQDLSFYLNSSDSLVSLSDLDQAGKKIMTVSGSGEFAHVFIQNGATEIFSFDISPAAAFNAELRHVALCNLNMNQYIQLFEGWTKSRGEDRVLYNQEIYKEIKNRLSNEAQLYFEQLFENPVLMEYGNNTWGGFARARYNKEYKHNRFVGDIITTEEEYLELQKKAKKVKFTQVISDATKMEDLIRNLDPDQIYQSNVGYRFESIVNIAHENAMIGNRNVVCTVSPRDNVFTDKWGENAYDFDNLYYRNQRVDVGDEITHELWHEDGEISEIEFKIIGIDQSTDYGVTIIVFP